ncbi:MAG: hypothetical protein CAF43_004340 [Nitrospira sp. CG24C]|nr:MAG: hypothetical protein CAF43_004340 [Nitrospira sp. CG24C]
MKVSQTLAGSVSSVLFLSMMTLSAGLALAEHGDEGGVQLKAKMVSGTASGKASYQESGNRRRLNLEAANLPNATQSLKAVFVNGVWVGNVTFAACPAPAQQLLCGAMDLNTQEGQAVPVVTGGQTVQIGLSPAILAGTF